MAEYYPLLAKAVASLPNSTLETRHAIYERARKALLGQLRAVQPPVPEADIERENQALDLAIAKLEREFAVPASPDVDRKMQAPAAVPPQPAGAPPRSPSAATRPPIAPAARPRVASTNPKPEGPVPASAGPEPIPAREKALEAKAETVVPDSKLAAPGLASPPPASMKMRPEQQRPVAPQVKGTQQNPKGLWIVLAVIGFIVAGVGFAAWKLRDHPEDLTKLKSAQTQQQPDNSGKIVERVGDSTKAKTADAAGTNTAAATPVEPSTTNVPVTYRAALLVQAPEEQNKVKTYYGTVIWRLDNVSNGPGEPLGTAIHANIDIPEDKFQASMTVQKNVDASLSASHTMTIVFTIQPSTPTGAIKQIGVPQMRKEDSATGESLIGLPVPIMENSFLIGLAKGNAEATNLDLLKSRQWIDVPMLLADGRIAKLTFEKGVAGLRATEDAITSWQTQ
jgi:hypothetical protein